jgi:hypothetical protein
MKNKNILIAIVSFLFFSTNSYAQEPGEWTEPAVHPCFQGITISLKNMGYSKDAGGYRWGIKLTNDKYKLPVSFKFKLSIGEKITSKEGWLATGKLEEGESHSDAHDKFTAWTYSSSSEEWFVYIWDVCFDGMRCGGGDECFAECDKTGGKENQLCGLSEDYKPTPGSNQPSLLSGKASAPNEEEPEDKGPADKWEADDKTGELQVIKKEDGLLVKLEGEKEYRFFKKIGDKTYRHETGKEFDIIKFSTDDKFSYWHNGELQNHYTLVTEDDGESKVRSGIWEGNSSKVKITVTEKGLTYHAISNLEDGSPFYKKISATEYRRYDADGILYSALTLKEDGRLHETFTDKPGSYVKLNELVFVSADEEDKATDKTQPLSFPKYAEWQHSKYSGIRFIALVNDDFLILKDKGVPLSWVYEKISANTYENKGKTSSIIIKFISNARYSFVTNSKTDTVYYQLVSSDLSQDKPKTITQSIPDIDIVGKWQYVGTKEYRELELSIKGDSLYAKFPPYGGKPWLYKKTSQFVYTFKTDSTESVLRYLNNTTISISYQHRNLNTLSYYTRPAAPPIVKQENKPAPVTENKTVIGGCPDLSGEWLSVEDNVYYSGRKSGVSHPVTIKITSVGLVWSSSGQGKYQNCDCKKISATSYRCDYLKSEWKGWYGILTCENNSIFFQEYLPNGIGNIRYKLQRK